MALAQTDFQEGQIKGREHILAQVPDVVAKLASGAAAREQDGRLPHELFQTIRDSGLTYLRVPESLGGQVERRLIRSRSYAPWLQVIPAWPTLFAVISAL